MDWIQLALWVCSALHLLIRILLPNKAIGKYVMYPVFVDSKMWVFGEFVVHASVCTSPPICSVISVSAMLARFLPNHCSYSFQGQGWRCRWQSDCAHTNCFGMGGIRSWLVSESPGVDLGCYRMLNKWLTYYHFKTKGYNATLYMEIWSIKYLITKTISTLRHVQKFCVNFKVPFCYMYFIFIWFLNPLKSLST